MECPHGVETAACTPCHNKAVWAQVEKRTAQAKIMGLERALRVEYRPTVAKNIRNELNKLRELIA